MMNLPEGLRWNTVLESISLAGMTGLTTFSIKSSCSCLSDMVSSCCVEITTVWTRIGMHAPSSNRYSTVTCKKHVETCLFMWLQTNKTSCDANTSHIWIWLVIFTNWLTLDNNLQQDNQPKVHVAVSVELRIAECRIQFKQRKHLSTT